MSQRAETQEGETAKGFVGGGREGPPSGSVSSKKLRVLLSEEGITISAKSIDRV